MIIIILLLDLEYPYGLEMNNFKENFLTLMINISMELLCMMVSLMIQE